MNKETKKIFDEIDKLLAVDLTSYKVNKMVHDGYWEIGQKCLPFLKEESTADKEYLVIFYINGEEIEKEIVNTGSSNRVKLPKGFELKPAQFYVLAHNHPPKPVKEFLMPSEPDNNLTKFIRDMALNNGSELCDHLIVSPEGHYSYREHGWILT